MRRWRRMSGRGSVHHRSHQDEAGKQDADALQDAYALQQGIHLQPIKERHRPAHLHSCSLQSACIKHITSHRISLWHIIALPPSIAAYRNISQHNTAYQSISQHIAPDVSLTVTTPRHVHALRDTYDIPEDFAPPSI